MMIVTIDYKLPLPDYDGAKEIVVWFVCGNDTRPLQIDQQYIYSPDTLVRFAREQYPEYANGDTFHFGVQTKDSVVSLE